MDQKAHVLAVRQYDFEADDGSRVKGTKVLYLDGSNEDEADARGQFPQAVTGPYGLMSQFPKLPGKYVLDLTLRNGKAKLVSAKSAE